MIFLVTLYLSVVPHILKNANILLLFEVIVSSLLLIPASQCSDTKVLRSARDTKAVTPKHRMELFEAFSEYMSKVKLCSGAKQIETHIHTPTLVIKLTTDFHRLSSSLRSPSGRRTTLTQTENPGRQMLKTMYFGENLTEEKKDLEVHSG